MNRLRDSINALPRRGKQLVLVLSDCAGLLVALWLSYSLRLGGNFNPSLLQLAFMALAPVVAVPIFIRLGLYRSVIRYLPERAIWTILRAMTLAAVVWFALMLVAELFPTSATQRAVPRSIPAFYWFFGVIIIGGSRFLAKAFLVSSLGPKASSARVLIYGAGSAGTQLAAALRAQGEYSLAGFLDDNPALHRRDVSGLRVYSPDELQRLIDNYGVHEVILSMPSLSETQRQAIITRLADYPVKIRALPAIGDLVAGRYIISQLREIDIDDLLGRSSVPADPDLLRTMLQDRSVLVTGAGGTIGSELCRLIGRWSPKRLVLLEANEFALYEIERKLLPLCSFPIIATLGSITDGPLIERTLRANEVDVVFHAAAHKHVPMLEANVLEGIRNNVFGTQVMAEAALAQGVSSFVLISSDKAVRPTSVMGATKRWAELIVRACGERPEALNKGLRFCGVRFGNVLGSNGSVVPLFREQIAAGGPVTLTDGRMTRYFMSIHEAAELIVQAGALSEGGDIFLLEMGEPVRIRDLAENMIRLAGFSVRNGEDGDIEIHETGIRPGEKLFEELFYDPSKVTRTRQPKIMRARRGELDREELDTALVRLSEAVERQDEACARAVLFGLIQK